MDRLIFEKESRSEADTEKYGGELGTLLRPGDFIALYGDLGVGKTAFVRGVCAVFCPGARVCSPTYTVMRRCDGGVCPFYHFDMYRVSSPDDLESVGFYDCDGIIAAEWCENIPWALPRRRYEVTITRVDETRRRIRLVLCGEGTTGKDA